MTPFLRKIFHEQRIAQDIGSVMQFAGPIVGGLIGQDAASSAADAQAKASAQASQATLQAQREANDLQKYMYDTSRKDSLPFLNNGTAASNRLSYLLGLPVSGTNAGAGGASSNGFTALTANDLANTTGAWTPNSTLYANSPEYKQAWDTFIKNHAAQYGVNPNSTLGSDASQLAGQLQQYGFNLDNYNAAQTQKSQADAAAAQKAAQADPAYGSLLGKFDQNAINNDIVYQKTYQTALDQGQNALSRMAAANGNLYSGAAAKALQDRAAQTANTYLGDAYNRFTNDKGQTYNFLAGASGAGQTAANTLSSAGSNYANAGTSTALSTGNALSNLYTGAGNSRAASSIAGGNALSGGLNSISNYYQTQNLLSKLGSVGSAGSSNGIGAIYNDINGSGSNFRARFI